MNTLTSAVLGELNRSFYAEHADEFACTRRSWPPGFQLILPHLFPAANVLDLGCGNGRLLAFLAAQGWQGGYVGVDNSERLLASAEQTSRKLVGIHSSFVLADLLSPNWPASLVAHDYDAIVSLALLHHIPARDSRARFLANCATLLPVGGRLVLSTWQFMSSPRLRARVLPWHTIGLSDKDVEPGDYLLAWGVGAAGQRYCALVGQEELGALAADAGLNSIAVFRSDGHEGNLNLYGVYAKPAA
jgi:tRNA (uracil-5-)-methyltransferase TRM9